MNENKKIYIDYEITHYLVRGFNARTKANICNMYSTEESAIKGYKELLETDGVYGIVLEKVSHACQFYDENNYVYTFDDWGE